MRKKSKPRKRHSKSTSPRSAVSADIEMGRRIRLRRAEKGISQIALAKHLDISFQQVQKYEKGVNRVGAGRLPLIAGIFGIPVSALFDPNADTGATGAAPVKLVPDKSTLRLLTSFADVTHRGIRRCLIELIDEIAKAELQQREKKR
jgi:transcriptional regulator with XRE-family HTH domain